MNFSEQFCNQQFEQLPLELKRVLMSFAFEFVRASEKHPNWPADQIHAAGIVVEESGEAMRAALIYEYENGSLDEIREEVIHTGATAARMLFNLPKEEQAVPSIGDIIETHY
jgi:hypothetical protein